MVLNLKMSMCYVCLMAALTAFFLFSQTVMFKDEDSLVSSENDASEKYAVTSLIFLVLSLMKVYTLRDDEMYLCLSYVLILVSYTFYMGMQVCDRPDYSCL